MGEPVSRSAFGERPAAPWAAPRGLGAVMEAWRGDPSVSRCVALEQVLPARQGRYAPLPGELADPVAAALENRGIERLYDHQAESFTRARDGEHLVVATPTASGKSLCYNLPVLDRLAREPAARALYLFPTKALARDQEQALRALMKEARLEHGAVTYDGDTPGDARRAARERSGVLLSNPDMLHAGILPHHAAWARFFANLRFVVLDELHTYRGVFGSHLANVLRRLTRIARFHGSEPTFLFASATIGNPDEHASRILGQPVSLIGESGAPVGQRRVMVYNPPVVNPELGIRASYVKTAVRLAADLVRAEVPTLVFGQSRNSVETMLKYLRDRLAADKVDPELIQAYRGGYLADTRRRIESGLRNGSVRCVVATNALELGIDIGSLEAVVCAGYPGNVAGLWQRFGRGGRRQGDALSLLVTSSHPLDQYVANDPRFLIGAPVESARIDPDNVEILIQHLKCAAFELPFEEGEAFGDVPEDAVADALGFLETHRVVHAAPNGEGKRVWHWATDAYPANHVSLRSVGWDNYVIVDLDRDRTIAEMDWRSTHTMLHEQAIYQHEGEQYQVEKLDYENHKAYVRKVEPDYYTDAMTYTNVRVMSEDDGAWVKLGGDDGFAAGVGEVSVVEKVVGYKKIKFHTHENVGYGDVRLPEMQMHTTAFWLTVSEDVVRRQPVSRATVVDALRGLGNAMHLVAAVGLMCDPRDLGQTLGDRSDEDGPPTAEGGGPGFDPTLFLYDQVPGGVGLATRLFVERETLVRRTRSLVEGCPCEDGCPACIGPDVGALTPGGAPPSRSPVARKALALDLMRALGVAPTH
ncbi:MAG TPA: DEAD/DEAH box helicase [Sandaracinaceae bacterium LLY-WYZ-13_1]|nr:DEAD/DEAH box helicase [Sandaracinaceae bacterium LLY-WYZ-13_1]